MIIIIILYISPEVTLFGWWGYNYKPSINKQLLYYYYYYYYNTIITVCLLVFFVSS